MTPERRISSAAVSGGALPEPRAASASSNRLNARVTGPPATSCAADAAAVAQRGRSFLHAIHADASTATATLSTRTDLTAAAPPSRADSFETTSSIAPTRGIEELASSLAVGISKVGSNSYHPTVGNHTSTHV